MYNHVSGLYRSLQSTLQKAASGKLCSAGFNGMAAVMMMMMMVMMMLLLYDVLFLPIVFLPVVIATAAVVTGWFSTVLLASQLEGVVGLSQDDQGLGSHPPRIHHRRRSESSLSGSPPFPFLQPKNRASFLTPDPTSSPSPPSRPQDAEGEGAPQLKEFDLGSNAAGPVLQPEKSYQLSPSHSALHSARHSYGSVGLMERQGTFESYGTDTAEESRSSATPPSPSKHRSRTLEHPSEFSLIPAGAASQHHMQGPRAEQQEVAIFLAQTTAMLNEWCTFWSHFQVSRRSPAFHGSSRKLPPLCHFPSQVTLSELLASHELLNSLYYSDTSVQFHERVSTGVRQLGKKWQRLKDASSAYLSSASSASLSTCFDFLRTFEFSEKGSSQ